MFRHKHTIKQTNQPFYFKHNKNEFLYDFNIRNISEIMLSQPHAYYNFSSPIHQQCSNLLIPYCVNKLGLYQPFQCNQLLLKCNYNNILTDISTYSPEFQQHYADSLIQFCINEIKQHNYLQKSSMVSYLTYYYSLIKYQYTIILQNLLLRFQPQSIIVFTNTPQPAQIDIIILKECQPKLIKMCAIYDKQCQHIYTQQSNQFIKLVQSFNSRSQSISPRSNHNNNDADVVVDNLTDKMVKFINNIEPISEFDVEICDILKRYMSTNTLDAWHENLNDISIFNIN